jgi:Ca-activated chloride channel family protein
MSEILKAVTGLAALALGKGGRKDEGEKGGGAPAAATDGKVEVKATLDRQKIDGSKDYEGHLMVSVTGSDRGFKRTPICTVLVLDVSSSMKGEKLAALKDTASKLARNLTDQDEVAIVAFASHVETVLERTGAGDRAAVLAAIGRLQATTCTNMSGGLSAGLKQVNEQFRGVKRIMLLTDGMANEGVSDRAGLLGMVAGRQSSCAVSTFGFGTDCDQELLADMAKAGGGNYYFIAGKDIGSVFARELGGMLSCIAQNLEVSIRPNKGGEVLEVLNDFTVEDKGGEAVINAEDLYAGETKHVLVRLRVAKPGGRPKARPFSVAHVAVSWDDATSKGHERRELNPKVTFARAKDADAEPALEVAEQVALVQAANAQLEAVKAAERGDWDGAQGALRCAVRSFSLLADRGSESARGLVGAMRASAVGFHEGTYTHSYGSTVSNAALNATKYRKGGGDGAEFLSSCVGSKGVDDMEAAFRDADGDGQADPNAVAGTTTSPTPPTAWTNGDSGGAGHIFPSPGGPPLPFPPADPNWPCGPGLPTWPGGGPPQPADKCTGAADCPCWACALKRMRVRPRRGPGQRPGPMPNAPKGGEQPAKAPEPGAGGGEPKSKFAKRSKRWK